jgi:hypothetical protein
VKRRKRCTECGELGHDLLRRLDAGGAVHWFHPERWKTLLSWLTEVPK